MEIVSKYLKKFGKAEALSIRKKFRLSLVIPALAESEDLPTTLYSLARNKPELLETCLIIIVINQKPDSSLEIIADNKKTIEILQENSFKLPHLHYLDIITTNGVGEARKSGMDTALQYLDFDANPLIFCLDADTLLEDNYLEEVSKLKEYPAAVVNFQHRLPADETLAEAIIAYEFFMRYYVLGLRFANSPYAFHSIGSAMICRAKDYIKCGGMREKNGGEDFYFMEALRKIGKIGFIDKTCVYPDGRLSDRVAFGTGPKLQKIISGEKQNFYCFRIFEELKKLLNIVKEEMSENLLQSFEKQLLPETIAFLQAENFPNAWRNIYLNFKKRPEALQQAFHTWFDGLKTLKFCHYLENNNPELQRIDLNTAWENIQKIYQCKNIAVNNSKSKLKRIRELDRKNIVASSVFF